MKYTELTSIKNEMLYFINLYSNKLFEESHYICGISIGMISITGLIWQNVYLQENMVKLIMKKIEKQFEICYLVKACKDRYL